MQSLTHCININHKRKAEIKLTSHNNISASRREVKTLTSTERRVEKKLISVRLDSEQNINWNGILNRMFSWFFSVSCCFDWKTSYCCYSCFTKWFSSLVVCGFHFITCATAVHVDVKALARRSWEDLIRFALPFLLCRRKALKRWFNLLDEMTTLLLLILSSCLSIANMNFIDFLCICTKRKIYECRKILHSENREANGRKPTEMFCVTNLWINQSQRWTEHIFSYTCRVRHNVTSENMKLPTPQKKGNKNSTWNYFAWYVPQFPSQNMFSMCRGLSWVELRQNTQWPKQDYSAHMPVSGHSKFMEIFFHLERKGKAEKGKQTFIITSKRERKKCCSFPVEKHVNFLMMGSERK